MWHGTTAGRAEKIREHGLAHKRGVWAATAPRIAHGYTRGRSAAFGAGSAMVVVLIDKFAWDARGTREHEDIARFHEPIPAACIEYILYADRIEFCGSAARRPRPWGKARFRRKEGRWVPQSRTPVRLDARRQYETFEQWLELSVGRVLEAFGEVAAVEVLSVLYATLDPWRALDHRDALAAIERLGLPGRSPAAGTRRFRRRP